MPGLRCLILRGSLRGSAEEGRFSLPLFLGGMGAGSGIQLRWRSRGGRVTIKI